MSQTLIISNPQDEHASVVGSKIAAMGGSVLVLHPEALPASAGITIALGDNQEPEIRLPFEHDADPYSVWHRRPLAPEAALASLTSEARDLALDDWRAVLEGAYSLLRPALWVSHPERLREAAVKVRQLTLARNLGLSIPKTVVTSSPQTARDFIESCSGEVAAKAIGRGWAYDASGGVVSILTNKLRREDIDELDAVALAPVLFQEYVPKAYELRVNVVGQEVLAIKIDSQSSPWSAVDWRRYDLANTPYASYELPGGIEELCLRLTQTLGLEFGAIDLIRKPDGEYVFLEINGSGQFLWAEERSGVRVSDAVARLLCEMAPPLAQLDRNHHGERRHSHAHSRQVNRRAGAVSLPFQGG